MLPPATGAGTQYKMPHYCFGTVFMVSFFQFVMQVLKIKWLGSPKDVALIHMHVLTHFYCMCVFEAKPHIVERGIRDTGTNTSEQGELPDQASVILAHANDTLLLLFISCYCCVTHYPTGYGLYINHTMFIRTCSQVS